MDDGLAAAFERERPRLRGVAYRMLGSLADADDAVQEAWLRLSRNDSDEVRNLGAWLTTVVGRIALDMLRARRTRKEDPFEDAVVSWPDPVVSPPDGLDPEQEALLADSVGLALMVVLETLTPAERLAFVLHDLFAVPFAEIGPMLDRSEDAAKMLASRARRRVQGASVSTTDRSRQRDVVAAFQAAARDGDFDTLLAVLDPDVEIVSDVGARYTVGAEAAARHAMSFRRFATVGRPVLVNGAPGILVLPEGAPPYALLAFTVRDGLITRLDVVAARERLARLDVSALGA
ncbi:MAG: sigma-70 family RNA polymerase sigma factor [Nocardioides sp.]|nr:sigma-70 family RNA polymerase sigma factor [Nocardioides sp.]